MENPVDPVWGLKLSKSDLEELQKGDKGHKPTFKELEDVEPLNAEDLICFTEIKEILEKHNKLDRFGITLLHKHFEMQDNEILLESTSAEERKMTLEPKILDTDNLSAIDTQWYLGKTMPLSLVKCRTSMHT